MRSSIGFCIAVSRGTILLHVHTHEFLLWSSCITGYGLDQRCIWLALRDAGWLCCNRLRCIVLFEHVDQGLRRGVLRSFKIQVLDLLFELAEIELAKIFRHVGLADWGCGR